jgi:transcriptional regulator with XRE-family HTH domain
MMAMTSETALELFGRVVRQYRRNLNLTQKELATRTGWKPSFIGEVEAGKRNVTFHTILRLARAFDIEASALFELVDKRPELYPGRKINGDA